MEKNQHYSIQEINQFLQHQPVELQDIVLELRNLVLCIAPQATERLLWGGIAYHNAEIGGPVKGAICQICVYRDHVQLAFIHGAFLPDPSGLLRGERKYKRYIKIESLEEVNWSAIEALIRAAVAFNATMLTQH
jgi:hypothetical protein